MGRNLIIGSSHSLQFAACLGAFTATWQEASRDLIRIESAGPAENWLLFTTHRPDFIEFREEAGRLTATFGPMIEKIRSFNSPDSTVVFAIGGNEHNIRFLRANPDPFDFVHPSVPTTDPARQIIPLGEMRSVAENALTPSMTVTRLIARQVPKAKRYCLAPPPPIPSEAHIRSQPEVFDFGPRGVESAHVRLKIYNLYNEILAAFCAGAGLEFLPPPTEARDGEGFLREAFWSGSTHAAPEYYMGYLPHLGL